MACLSTVATRRRHVASGFGARTLVLLDGDGGGPRRGSAHTVSRLTQPLTRLGLRRRSTGALSRCNRYEQNLACHRLGRLASTGWCGGVVVAGPRGCVIRTPTRRRQPAFAGADGRGLLPRAVQDDAKQDGDRYECDRWAVRETARPRHDAGARRVIVIACSVRDGAEVVAGAANGAIVGAAVSSPHNNGQGMVLGAIFGTMYGAAAHEARVQSAEQAYARHVRRARAGGLFGARWALHKPRLPRRLISPRAPIDPPERSSMSKIRAQSLLCRASPR